jgi:hypothetical protein
MVPISEDTSTPFVLIKNKNSSLFCLSIENFSYSLFTQFDNSDFLKGINVQIIEYNDHPSAI